MNIRNELNTDGPAKVNPEEKKGATERFQFNKVFDIVTCDIMLSYHYTYSFAWCLVRASIGNGNFFPSYWCRFVRYL